MDLGALVAREGRAIVAGIIVPDRVGRKDSPAASLSSVLPLSQSFGQCIVDRQCILRKMPDTENQDHVRPDREYSPMSSLPTKAIVELADLHWEVIVLVCQPAPIVVLGQ